MLHLQRSPRQETPSQKTSYPRPRVTQLALLRREEQSRRVLKYHVEQTDNALAGPPRNLQRLVHNPFASTQNNHDAEFVFKRQTPRAPSNMDADTGHAGPHPQPQGMFQVQILMDLLPADSPPGRHLIRDVL